MTITAKALIDAKFASAIDATEYTCPANTHTIIDKFTVTNIDAGAITVTINIVKNGDSLGPLNTIVSAKSIATGVTSDLTEMQNQVLNAGDFISVTTNTANKVIIRSSGREVT